MHIWLSLLAFSYAGETISGVRYPYQAVLVPAGSFDMGCTNVQGGDCMSWDNPARTVSITHSLYLMESEVTTRVV